MPPSEGRVLVRGIPLVGFNPQVAIVFQSFALFPWLTVLDNVELGGPLISRQPIAGPVPSKPLS